MLLDPFEEQFHLPALAVQTGNQFGTQSEVVAQKHQPFSGVVLDLVFAPVIGHTASKRTQRQIDHELRKYELALVHDGFGRKSAKNRKSDFRRSNRDQTEALNSSSKSVTYEVST